MTEFIISLLGGGGLWGILAAAGAALAAVVGMYLKGRADGAGAVKRKADKLYIKTRKAMDDAEITDDPSSAAEWLRRRAEERDL